VLETGLDESAKDLRNDLKTRLPGYMLPSAFVFLEQLPLTPNGKINRKILPPPAKERNTQDVPYAAPRTEVEERLAAIWAEVLKLERVGINDNFFELGGTSIMATQVVSRVRKQFTLEMPVILIFEASSVAEYAELVMQARFDQTDDDTLAQLLANLDQ
jgi:acyl carrier protein